MSAAALIPSLIPLIVVASMRRAEARVHRRLADAGAQNEQSAIALAPSRSFERRRLEALIRGGAVRVTPNGRYFLDADGWSAYQRNRRRRALFAVSVVVALIGLAAAVAFLVR